MCCIFAAHFYLQRMPYIKQDKPFRVPTTDGKLIEEHVGMASTVEVGHSIAHMVAPGGWSEPFQNPAFDEYTLVSRGKKQFDVDGETVIVNAGESILIKAVAVYVIAILLMRNANTGAFVFQHFQWLQ